MRYGIYLARIETHITITGDGWLHSETTFNKSYGPNDRGSPEQREIRKGQLTKSQMHELAAALSGWEKLSTQYGGVPDGGHIEFRYGDKLITGGSAVPDQVTLAHSKINTFANSFPVVSPPNQ